MRSVLLVAVLFVSAPLHSQAGNYLTTAGDIVPLNFWLCCGVGGNRPQLDGILLEPGADLSFATLQVGFDGGGLSNASLRGANFSGSNLSAAILIGADLRDVNFSGALLGGTSLPAGEIIDGSLLNRSTQLDGADLRGANFTNAVWMRAISGAPLYDELTNFTGASLEHPGFFAFDPVAAGWILVPVPEPGTATLLGLGLLGLVARRRSA